MTPERIRRQLAELREAGAKLRRRPARETLDALGRVLDGWSDAESKWRRALVAELPAATGFTAETVRAGLAEALGHWNAQSLGELVERELGPGAGHDAARANMASGFDTTAVLLAGSIPMPTFLSLLAPLVLRSPVLAKSAARDPVSARLFADSVAEVDPELGRCIAIADFSGTDRACVAALLEADCVVATGSDATVADVRARLPAVRRFVGHGHKLSVAALGAEALEGPALEATVAQLSRDVALWDQLGCLSPIAVYVAEPAAAGRVAEALAVALATAQTRWPRGLIEVAAANALAHERAEAEMRAATGADVAVYGAASDAFTVVLEDTARHRPAPLHRFVRVAPVAGAHGVLDALAPLGPQLAAVALAGFGSGSEALARALADLGASRVCAPGTLQGPPLGWRRGGQPVLSSMARFTDWEASR